MSKVVERLAAAQVHQYTWLTTDYCRVDCQPIPPVSLNRDGDHRRSLSAL